jgi:hypothetical protein
VNYHVPPTFDTFDLADRLIDNASCSSVRLMSEAQDIKGSWQRSSTKGPVKVVTMNSAVMLQATKVRVDDMSLRQYDTARECLTRDNDALCLYEASDLHVHQPLSSIISERLADSPHTPLCLHAPPPFSLERQAESFYRLSPGSWSDR